MSANNKKQLYIPRGFAHGFLVLSNEAIVNYKVDNIYNQNLDCGINYNDPQIDIDWKLNDKIIKLSSKDVSLPFVTEKNLKF